MITELIDRIDRWDGYIDTIYRYYRQINTVDRCKSIDQLPDQLMF